MAECSGSTGCGSSFILNPVKDDRQEPALRVPAVRPRRHADNVATDATDGNDGPGVIPDPSY
jgi:hypothetical protein